MKNLLGKLTAVMVAMLIILNLFVFAVVSADDWRTQLGDEFSRQDIRNIERLLEVPPEHFPRNVERLHWDEVRQMLPLHQNLYVFDVFTGITYIVRSMSNGNHADVEMINHWHTSLHLYTFGGNMTWSGRPVWVTLPNGRTFAAAIHSMQHAGRVIMDNGMDDGHICLHFYGSTNNFTYRPFYANVIEESVRLYELLSEVVFGMILADWSSEDYVYTPYIPDVLPEMATSPRIRIDGEFVYISYDEQQPLIVDGRTLVPLRVVMEALGFDVHWNEQTRLITLVNPFPGGSALLMLPMQETEEQKGFPICLDTLTHFHGNLYTSNTRDADGLIIPLDVPPQIINGRTMVPVRAISEATGMDVVWDGENMIIDIFTGADSELIVEEVVILLLPEPILSTHLSAITLPDRVLTDSEMQNWQTEYTTNGGINEFELEVVRLLNIERANYGFVPLEIDSILMMAARFKSQSMSDLNYMAHTGVYGAPWDLMRAFGFSNTGFAAENIAKGQRTPEAVMESWMNSPGHRANILGENYRVIGVGAFADENGRISWTQMFSSTI